jgi:hypothetical protein
VRVRCELCRPFFTEFLCRMSHRFITAGTINNVSFQCRAVGYLLKVSMGFIETFGSVEIKMKVV